MTNDDSQSIMDTWRQFRTARLQSPEAAPKTHTELLAMLDQVQRAIAPYVLPPQVGLGARLATIVSNWQVGWSHELKNSEVWTTASSTLGSIRDLIQSGDLAAAEFQLLSMLVRGCSGARRITFPSPQIRAQTSDLNDAAASTDPQQQTHPTETAEGLSNLLDWLSQLSA